MNPHIAHPAHPGEMFAGPWRHRNLLRQLVRSDVLGRYRGSVAGLAWSFFNPLLMLAVYTFVFSSVFKARWPIDGADESPFGFALVLFVGLILHGLLAECINKAPGLILNNVNYVKKVVFPLEMLAWVALASAHFHALISVIVFLLVQFVMTHSIPWTAILLPMIVFPFSLMVVGLTWFISATGVFIRDIAQITGIISSALMFLAPIFYPLSSLPESFRNWLYLNPLTVPVEQARRILIQGEAPQWQMLGIYAVVACVVAWGGFWWFQRTRKGFADVL